MSLTFKWAVTTNYLDKDLSEVPLYSVYRNLREGEPDHSGNREYKNISFANKAAAQKYADELNKQEGN